MRVLLAEDNEINVLYAKALFQRWNVQVDIARDGLEALACFETQSYDVVLLDVQMPNLDGLATLRRMRTMERQERERETCPIFMVTAFADDETRTTSVNEGANGFLAKPFSPSDMMNVLRNIIEK